MSTNVNCELEQHSSSQVWEEIATFPSRSVGINLPINCFIFSSQSSDWFSIPDTRSWQSLLVANAVNLDFLIYLSQWVLVKDSMVHNEGLFRQEFSPNRSQDTEILSTSNSHCCQHIGSSHLWTTFPKWKNSCTKKTATYWQKPISSGNEVQLSHCCFSISLYFRVFFCLLFTY